MREYFQSIKKRDPAARNILQIILTYPGVHAVFWYRIAHFIYTHHFKLVAEWIMFCVRCTINIEIHPAAIIGNDVTMYHGVTLGGVGRGGINGKRHPTVEDGVTIGAGAKILGDITLGEGCIIGANAVVLKDVPPYSTSVGIPSVIKK